MTTYIAEPSTLFLNSVSTSATIAGSLGSIHRGEIPRKRGCVITEKHIAVYWDEISLPDKRGLLVVPKEVASKNEEDLNEHHKVEVSQVAFFEKKCQRYGWLRQGSSPAVGSLQIRFKRRHQHIVRLALCPSYWEEDGTLFEGHEVLDSFPGGPLSRQARYGLQLRSFACIRCWQPEQPIWVGLISLLQNVAPSSRAFKIDGIPLIKASKGPLWRAYCKTLFDAALLPVEHATSPDSNSDELWI